MFEKLVEMLKPSPGSEILLFLGGVLGLQLSRLSIYSIILFAICYAFLVHITIRRGSLIGLVLSGTLAALVLSLRFKYRTWGDPWFEYAMIQDIMKSGMISPEYYPDQEPTFHTLIAAASVYTRIGAMELQRFVIPVLGTLSILALYRLSREFLDRDTSIVSAFLLSVGTAYIHWISQAVTESLGIAIALIALYISCRALKETRFIPASILLITGLVLTHHLSTLMFIAWWNFFAIPYVYLVSDNPRDALRGMIISTFSLAAALFWWSSRMPNILAPVSKAVDSIFHMHNSLALIVLILVIIYALPFQKPFILKRVRDVADAVLSFRTAIYFGCILIGLFGAFMAMNLLLGRSFFVLKYPILFFGNGFMMLILAVIGLQTYLYRDKIPILTWASATVILFIGSVLKVYAAEDPIRFIEFLYPALSVISASGFLNISKMLSPGVRASVIAIICLISLTLAFPAVVFWGQEYPPSDIRYDPRSAVISHPESEMIAIEYLGDYGAHGSLHTDRYVSYASMHLENITSDTSIALLLNSRAKSYGRETLDPDKFPKGDNFVILTQRMKRYAEFGEWLLKEKTPLKDAESSKIDIETSRVYDNDDALIYNRRIGDR